MTDHKTDEEIVKSEEIISPEATAVIVKKTKIFKRKVEPENSEYVTFSLSGINTPVAILLSAVILSIGVGLGLYFGLRSQTPTTMQNQTVPPTVTTGDPYVATAFPEATVKVGSGAFKGTRAVGKVTIVEFSDFMCIFCRQFITGVDARSGTDTGLSAYEQIVANYINPGKVALTYRQLPIQGHDPAATELALASECVRQDAGDVAFFKFHDYVFAQFTGLTNTANTQKLELIRSKLEDAVVQSGANKAKVMSCFDQKATQSVLIADLQDVTALTAIIQSYLQTNGLSGIGTPGFVIGKLQSDGTVKGRFIGGAYPYQAFKNVIDEQLTK